MRDPDSCKHTDPFRFFLMLAIRLQLHICVGASSARHRSGSFVSFSFAVPSIFLVIRVFFAIQLG